MTDGLEPLLRHLAHSREVKLTVAVPPELPPILVDSGHFHQVLIHLLINAIESSPAGGLVEVVASPRSDDGQAGVVVTVRDTGPGVPADMLSRIFDPLFSSSSVTFGTRLGLAISRDLMRSNGSDVQVASTPGQGTTLHHLAPRCQVRCQEGAVMRRRILVVDNDGDMVALLRRHLEGEGWAVTAVTSGQDAQAALGREEYTAVLTDLVMEPVDGLGVLREAQRVQPRARVILMTAFGSLESAIDAMRRGAVRLPHQALQAP